MPSRRLTPETKTLRYLTNGRGMIAGLTARRAGRLSFDLWGFVDVIGFAPRGLTGGGEDGSPAPMLCVQATASAHQANRQRKILESDELRLRAWALIASGHQVEVWGWLRGRTAATEAFRRFTLEGRSRAGLVFHDRGIVEVAAEILEGGQ